MTTTPNPIRLCDKAKTYIVKALKADFATSHEKVVWEVTLALFPDPAENDLVPALSVYLEIPGVDKDHPIYVTFVVAPFNLDEPRLTKNIDKALISMRETRQRKLDKPLDESEDDY